MRNEDKNGAFLAISQILIPHPSSLYQYLLFSKKRRPRSLVLLIWVTSQPSV